MHPQPESYAGHVSTTGPRVCYDEGKRAAEALMFDYRRMFGVEVKVARIFNTYGPRMLENDGCVVSNFIVQALRESPPDVTGSFNLGNPQEMSVEAIAREIVARTRSKSKLQFKPLPQDDPKRRKPMIDAAEKHLGWRPRVPLNDGLNATIAYFALQLAGETSGAGRSTTRDSSTKTKLVWPWRVRDKAFDRSTPPPILVVGGDADEKVIFDPATVASKNRRPRRAHNTCTIIP